MTQTDDRLSVVIPSYRRGQILLNTVQYLLELPVRPDEILIIDQTEEHPQEILEIFESLEKNVPVGSSGSQGLGKGKVRRIQLPHPSIPHAMNVGLQEAVGGFVLFLDDDVIPDEYLIPAHLKAYEDYPDARAVVGQVLQPEDNLQTVDYIPVASKSGLRRGLGFKFNSENSAWAEDVIACNLSVNKEFALRIGGFDENFIPPVSFRFETEYAKRLVAAGGKIRFEPAASIRHLRVGEGGTRSRGAHLTSASPIHGVGDYYYALAHGTGRARIAYILKRPFREVFTKFHLIHPWYIPVKLIGEIRALLLGLKLYRQGPRLLIGKVENSTGTREKG